MILGRDKQVCHRDESILDRDIALVKKNHLSWGKFRR